MWLVFSVVAKYECARAARCLEYAQGRGGKKGWRSSEGSRIGGEERLMQGGAELRGQEAAGLDAEKL